MLGLSPEAYVLRAVSSVRANDLEQALLLLPFADALKLMQWVAGWLAAGNQVGRAGGYGVVGHIRACFCSCICCKAVLQVECNRQSIAGLRLVGLAVLQGRTLMQMLVDQGLAC